MQWTDEYRVDEERSFFILIFIIVILSFFIQRKLYLKN